MLRIGYYSNGVYGKSVAEDTIQIGVSIIESVSQTGMLEKRGAGSAGLYEIALRGDHAPLRFLSNGLHHLKQDDIVFQSKGKLIAISSGNALYVFGSNVELCVRNSVTGAIAMLLALVGLPFFKYAVSNVLHQLVSMQTTPISDLEQIRGAYYHTDFDNWEPVAMRPSRSS